MEVWGEVVIPGQDGMNVIRENTSRLRKTLSVLNILLRRKMNGKFLLLKWLRSFMGDLTDLTAHFVMLNFHLR